MYSKANSAGVNPEQRFQSELLPSFEKVFPPLAKSIALVGQVFFVCVTLTGFKESEGHRCCSPLR